MGLDLGEVIRDADGDVYGGDCQHCIPLGSARPPGGIVVSGKVHDEVASKIPFRISELGLANLKNISKPVRTYAVAELFDIEAVSTRRESMVSRPKTLLGGPSIV